MSRKIDIDAKTLGLYRMWHAKDPTKAFELTFDFPDVVGRLGRAARIVYWSDKWEAPGDGYHYEHDFDSAPPVYCESVDGSTSVEKLMGVRGLNDTQSAWPILAEVCELSVRLDDTDKIKTFRFKKPPLMLTSADKKTLCILYKKEPLFIRGGRMVVTARGIVN